MEESAKAFLPFSFLLLHGEMMYTYSRPILLIPHQSRLVSSHTHTGSVLVSLI